MFSEMTYFNGVQETVPDMLKFIDKWGGPETYPHMAAGWAVMFDTPFTWTKQVASDHGGTKVGTAIHWPKGIQGQRRNCGPSFITSSTSRRRFWKPLACPNRRSSTA
jgi:hypothetical protein